jgi:lipopolysaccharide export system permease protein
MTVFDRYILKQLLSPMAITLLVGLLVMLIERMLRLLDLVLGSNGPLSYVLRMLAYLAPHFLGMAVPLAFFLAIVLAFTRMSRDSELDALFSAGIGLHRLIRPVVLMTAVFFLLAVFIFNTLQPHGRYAYREMIFAVKNAALHAAIKEGVFTTAGDTTFLIGRISGDREAFGKIFVYKEEEDGTSEVTTAARGTLDTSSTTGPPVAHLVDGLRMSVPKTADTAEKRAAVLRFEEFRAPLAGSGYTSFRARGRDERELTLVELWQWRHGGHDQVDDGDLVAELHGRLVRILTILGLPFLAAPLALGWRRSHRSYGLIFGCVVLIGYNEVLQFGERSVAHVGLSPALGLWLPLVVFLIGSGALFYKTAFLSGRPLGLRSLARAFEHRNPVVPTPRRLDTQNQ